MLAKEHPVYTSVLDNDCICDTGRKALVQRYRSRGLIKVVQLIDSRDEIIFMPLQDFHFNIVSH